MIVKTFNCVLLFMLVFICLNPVLAQSRLPLITSIQIEGNQSIETSTIQFAIKSQVNQQLDMNQVRRDIKALYKTGFYDDISVLAEQDNLGVKLIYRVSERPVITDIVITGATKIQLTTLNEELTIKTSERYDPVKTKESASKIEAKYAERGYNYAFVTPRISKESAAAHTLILAVDEGLKVKIDQIVFDGISKLKPGNRLFGLKSKMKENREYWWMSWLTSSGKFKEDLLKDDLVKIEEYYKNKGYLKASIGEPKINITNPDPTIKTKKQKRKVTIVIPVYEGEIYKLGNISAKVADSTIYPDKVVLDIVKSTRLEQIQKYLGGSAFFRAGPRFETGETYSYELEQEALKQLGDVYGMRGYLYAMIDPVKTIDESKKTVDITFTVTEGIQARLHRLEFLGNNRTRDRVLRRNLLLIEGDILNTQFLKEGIQRINYLGYIEEINPEVIPLVDPSQIDVNISLSDVKKTEIQVAGGYSDYERFYYTLGLTEHNLFGRGQDVSFSATSGKRRQTFAVSFADEWLFDRPYYGAISVWDTDRDYDYSQNRTIGASLTSGKSLGYHISTRLGYKWEHNKVYDIDDDADQEIKDLEGVQITSSLTSTWIRDTLNNRRDPTRGTYSEFRFEYAGGFLGGDNNFYKAEFEWNYFKELFKKLVVSLRTEVNYARPFNSDDLPFYERYSLGGPRSVRGYQERSIGPWDEYGQNLGGNKSMFLSGELIIPIATPLKIVFFADAGDSYSAEESYEIRSLRPSVGAELRFFVPGFWIPLRFIWGYNLDPYRDEDRNDFQFTIGTLF